MPRPRQVWFDSAYPAGMAIIGKILALAYPDLQYITLQLLNQARTPPVVEWWR